MKNKINLHVITILLALLFAFSSCNSIQELIEQGKYDEAFSLAARKMYGKKKKKPKHVLGMETAFRKLTERDMAQIRNLSAPEFPQNWEKTVVIYERIRDRQVVLDPLLPLYDKNGYKAEFRFIKVDPLIKDAMANASDHLYNSAKANIAKATAGDKAAARKAAKELQTIKGYTRHYDDLDYLQQKARELGTTHIFVKMENVAPVILPAGFKEEILRISTRDLNHTWNRYHLSNNPEIDFDYDITLRLTHIEVSPERIFERAYIDEKEIKDGFEYVLDQNGNVAKDTLGNDLKIDRYAIIRADILETRQSKEALVSGYIEYRDNRQDQLMHSDNFTVEAVFDHCAATFQGDSRALSSQSRRNLGNIPAPFPTDEILLLDAAAKLKQLAKNRIKQNTLVGI